jgi:D-alanyl-D-alanine carboxypeptidase
LALRRPAICDACAPSRLHDDPGDKTLKPIKYTVMVFVCAAVTSTSNAADYKPVKCDRALPYEGAALHAALSPEALKISGSLEGELPAPLAARLETAMKQAMSLTHAPVMTAAIAVPGQGGWHATLSADGSVSAQKLHWASVGKLFTATVILQLVEEGKLSLTDSIDKWFPKAPNAKVISVGDLLSHTSGLFSANEDLKVHASGRYLTPDEDVDVSSRHGAMFCPGQLWRYSNTGYVMLGRIIETVDGRPYHESVTARILTPLHLKDTHVLAPHEVPADLAPLTPQSSKERPIEPSVPYAAGTVIGSAQDMVLALHAMLTGKLLRSTATADRLAALYPMFDKGTFYGRGIMVYDIPTAAGEPKMWIGHSGGTPGAKAVVAYSPADKAFVAVALNTDGSAEATANLLLKQLGGGSLPSE